MPDEENDPIPTDPRHGRGTPDEEPVVPLVPEEPEGEDDDSTEEED